MGNLLLTTLFDSGANIMAVDRRLVTKSAYMGSYIPCLIFSGMVETCVFPIAVYQTSILHRSCRTLLFKKTCKSTDYRAITCNKEMHQHGSTKLVQTKRYRFQNYSSTVWRETKHTRCQHTNLFTIATRKISNACNMDSRSDKM